MLENAELAVLKYAAQRGDIKPFISLREAQRRYGTGTINRWIEEGLINIRKDGINTSKIRIDIVELEATAKASNRSTYIPANERKNE